MIADELEAELKDGMRERDRARINVIRQIKTEVAVLTASAGFDRRVDDALYVEIISSYSKKMQKAKDEFESAGERGREQAEKLAYEIEYLSRWLPAQLSREETSALVAKAIADVGASDVKDLGRVMGAVMKSGAEVDGALVNQLVREQLGG
ncbi:MAG: GatB/YqeY domain-containing protein [Acidimicrobiia bacterium]|nr:GatB/YqeY domain-containing protein [Acidimicrobiia bacterium]